VFGGEIKLILHLEERPRRFTGSMHLVEETDIGFAGFGEYDIWRK